MSSLRYNAPQEDVKSRMRRYSWTKKYNKQKNENKEQINAKFYVEVNQRKLLS